MNKYPFLLFAESMVWRFVWLDSTLILALQVDSTTVNVEYKVIRTHNSMHGWSHTSIVCRAGCILATVHTVNAAEAYEHKQDAS